MQDEIQTIKKQKQINFTTKKFPINIYYYHYITINLKHTMVEWRCNKFKINGIIHCYITSKRI